MGSAASARSPKIPTERDDFAAGSAAKKAGGKATPCNAKLSSDVREGKITIAGIQILDYPIKKKPAV
jgi:hypothetical protein